MLLSPDPSISEFQLFWEKQFWDKSKATWIDNANWYEMFKLFFGAARKPRDIFRADVADWKDWLKKKGWSNTRITLACEKGNRLYRLLNELELVEKDFNPFTGMAPRRIRT